MKMEYVEAPMPVEFEDETLADQGPVGEYKIVNQGDKVNGDEYREAELIEDKGKSEEVLQAELDAAQGRDIRIKRFLGLASKRLMELEEVA
jgi:hypothetical protein